MNAHAAKNPDLMTVTEASEYLGRSEGALRWQIQAKGDIPPHAKIAGRITFRKSLIDRWLDEKFEAAMKDPEGTDDSSRQAPPIA